MNRSKKSTHSNLIMPAALLFITLSLLTVSIRVFLHHSMAAAILCWMVLNMGMMGYVFTENRFYVNIINIGVLFNKHLYLGLLPIALDVDYIIVGVAYFHYISICVYEFFVFRRDLISVSSDARKNDSELDNLLKAGSLRSHFQNYCGLVHGLLGLYPFEHFSHINGNVELYVLVMLWGLLTVTESIKNYKARKIMLVRFPFAKCSALFVLPRISRVPFWLFVTGMFSADFLIIFYEFQSEKLKSLELTWLKFIMCEGEGFEDN